MVDPETDHKACKDIFTYASKSDLEIPAPEWMQDAKNAAKNVVLLLFPAFT